MNKKIVYNVTTIVDHSVHEEWYKWMQTIQIPAAIATGLFSEAKVMKVLENHNPDGVTYAVHYYAASFSDYQDYQATHGPLLQKAMHEKFEGKYASFTTLLTLMQ
jgi:hypothetical protein